MVDRAELFARAEGSYDRAAFFETGTLALWSAGVTGDSQPDVCEPAKRLLERIVATEEPPYDCAYYRARSVLAYADLYESWALGNGTMAALVEDIGEQSVGILQELLADKNAADEQIFSQIAVTTYGILLTNRGDTSHIAVPSPPTTLKDDWEASNGIIYPSCERFVTTQANELLPAKIQARIHHMAKIRQPGMHFMEVGFALQKSINLVEGEGSKTQRCNGAVLTAADYLIRAASGHTLSNEITQGLVVAGDYFAETIEKTPR